jgi:hypothetical protein
VASEGSGGGKVRRRVREREWAGRVQVRVRGRRLGGEGREGQGRMGGVGQREVGRKGRG